MYACANLSFLFKEAGPILSRYKAAASAGFKYVESDFPVGFTPEEVGQAVAEGGLQQVLINCFQGKNVHINSACYHGSCLHCVCRRPTPQEISRFGKFLVVQKCIFDINFLRIMSKS